MAFQGGSDPMRRAQQSAKPEIGVLTTGGTIACRIGAP